MMPSGTNSPNSTNFTNNNNNKLFRKPKTSTLLTLALSRRSPQ